MSVQCCAKNSGDKEKVIFMKSASCESVNDCDLLKTFLAKSTCSKKSRCTLGHAYEKTGRMCATYKLYKFRQEGRILQCSVTGEPGQSYYHFSFSKGTFRKFLKYFQTVKKI